MKISGKNYKKLMNLYNSASSDCECLKALLSILHNSFIIVYPANFLFDIARKDNKYTSNRILKCSKLLSK